MQQWQIALSDHSCRLPQASSKTRGASSQHTIACTLRLPPTSPTGRRATGPINRVPFATLATTLGRSRTKALRCSAAEHALDQADTSAQLQRQVDRLTKLLDTLQAASSWHDKARVVLHVCWQPLNIKIQPPCLPSGLGSAK